MHRETDVTLRTNFSKKTSSRKHNRPMLIMLCLTEQPLVGGSEQITNRSENDVSTASGQSTNYRMFGSTVKNMIDGERVECNVCFSVESIMTPRSRKPVMLLAGLNTADQQHTTYPNHSSFSSLREEDEDDATAESATKPYPITDNAPADGGTPPGTSGCVSTNDEICTAEGVVGLIGQGTDEGGSSLTSTFRDYLLSRSVMTDSPTDLSFSSQSDDFDSDADLEHLSESKMSESLLFCMNGNAPEEKVIDSQYHRVDIVNKDDKKLLEDSELTNKSELDETSL